MSYFTYQGKELFYQEAGQGEPCLFLHGNTASSRMFTFLLPLYTQHFRVILLDFLGNGKSQRPSRRSCGSTRAARRRSCAGAWTVGR